MSSTTEAADDRTAAMLAGARDSLIVYSLLVDPRYRANRFHRHLAKIIEQAVEAGRGRIMIFAPPQHGKSEEVSRKAPAWIMGKHPDWPIIAASYGDDLVELNGGSVRAAVTSPMHRAIFPACVLDPSTTAKANFATTDGGKYLGVTIRGGGTGFPAKCLPADTLVLTPTGESRIDSLRPGDLVATMNDAGEVVVRDILATASRTDEDIYRISTAAGRMVEATGDHPFFTGSGYTQARDLAPGAALLCAVRDDVQTAGVCSPQVGGPRAQGNLLLEEVPGGRATEAMRVVCNTIAKKARDVLRRVQAAAQAASIGASATGCDLPSVQSAVRVAASWSWEICRVLFGGLRESGARLANGGQRESALEGWGDASAYSAARRSRVSGNAADDSGARRPLLRALRYAKAIACASHRLLAGEQPRIESCDAVRYVSSEGACSGTLRAVPDIVAKVERIGRETVVCDIQVRETANFFAGGVLVHNCFIIDDPFKSRAEADSDTFREHVKNWYRSVVYPRLAEDSILIIMHTRWHDDDLAGWLMREHPQENWQIVSLPAIAEEGDELGRAPGEALVPERFSAKALDQKRLAVGSREWLSLYQQHPPKKGGGTFKREWVRFYEPKNIHRAVWMMNRYLLIDPARTQKKTSDYTAILVVGLHVDRNYYLLDAVYDRLKLRQRAAAVIEMHRRWKPLATGYKKTGHEQDIEYLEEAQGRENYRFRVVSLSESGPKETRIETHLAPDFEAERWWFPPRLDRADIDGSGERDLIAQFIEEEYLPFPAGRHDDFLDCLSGIKDIEPVWPAEARNRVRTNSQEYMYV